MLGGGGGFADRVNEWAKRMVSKSLCLWLIFIRKKRTTRIALKLPRG